MAGCCLPYLQYWPCQQQLWSPPLHSKEDSDHRLLSPDSGKLAISCCSLSLFWSFGSFPRKCWDGQKAWCQPENLLVIWDREMDVQEFCPIGWWFCRVRVGEDLSCHLVDTVLSSVSGLGRRRAGEAGEKALCLYAAAHHARQFLSDTKPPGVLLPRISGAGNGSPSTFWEVFLPPAVSRQ